MQLHELHARHPRRYPKTRIARGGKRGTTAGHGTKGQKSRSGHRIRPAERDFIQRLPKLRGIKNVSNAHKALPVNLGLIEARMKGTAVDPASLLKARLIRRPGTVKILGAGEVKRAFSFSGVRISASAKKKIEAAGGTIQEFRV
jgi:large subunit ribosomal protein L15